MQIEPYVFKGIEFVRLSELPVQQKDIILQAIQDDMLIKICTENEILTDCIQWKDYMNSIKEGSKTNVLMEY